VATSTPTNCTVTLTVNPRTLNFGRTEDELELELTAEGCLDVTFTVVPSEDWINLSVTSGVIPANGEIEVTVEIDRGELQFGPNTGQLVLQTSIGQLVIGVRAERVRTPNDPN
jgi:hypothetical protein